MEEKRLRIAIQKSGRLSEKSLEIIRSCGIDFNTDSRVLREVASNFPLEFLFVRDDDIPTYVADNVADIGIVGRNELDESGYDLNVVRDLGFASCRLSIAVPGGFEYTGLKCLEGKRIATSYPRILSSVLERNGVSASLVTVAGSVEITPVTPGIWRICCRVTVSKRLPYHRKVICIKNTLSFPKTFSVCSRFRPDSVSLCFHYKGIKNA